VAEPSSGRDLQTGLVVDLHAGDRGALRPLFELAEDSAALLDEYVTDGRVLVALLDGETVGHLQLVETGRAGELEIKNMAVREDRQGRGIGALLVRAAIARCTAEGRTSLLVATAAAGTGTLRFYQRQGFRMLSVERDAFTPETGYPAGIAIDGVPLRDRVWLDQPLFSGPGRR
jgi:GNAT superfamily N-acetyltransferase